MKLLALPLLAALVIACDGGSEPELTAEEASALALAALADSADLPGAPWEQSDRFVEKGPLLGDEGPLLVEALLPKASVGECGEISDSVARIEAFARSSINARGFQQFRREQDGRGDIVSQTVAVMKSEDDAKAVVADLVRLRVGSSFETCLKQSVSLGRQGQSVVSVTPAARGFPTGTYSAVSSGGFGLEWHTWTRGNVVVIAFVSVASEDRDETPEILAAFDDGVVQALAAD